MVDNDSDIIERNCGCVVSTGQRHVDKMPCGSLVQVDSPDGDLLNSVRHKGYSVESRKFKASALQVVSEDTCGFFVRPANPMNDVAPLTAVPYITAF